MSLSYLFLLAVFLAAFLAAVFLTIDSFFAAPFFFTAGYSTFLAAASFCARIAAQRFFVAAIIRWLEQCAQPWLLIFDNADDLSLIPSYLPSRGNGSILLTTRANAVGALASSVEVDCLDASERMLQLARERVEQTWPDRAAHVRFLHDDITSWIPLENHYDLIVTHFVLDCFREPELRLIVQKLAGAATQTGTWLLADFRVPSGGFARLRARVWLALMYGFFRVTARIEANELIDPAPCMQSQGFTLAMQHQFKSEMLKSESWRRNSLGSAGCQPAHLGSLPR